ncbi:hypothetical protein V5O48_003055 [Marasmius crinis-equi]|uniref:RCC1-like domain-containing protein n=1 Tax=Marasmius crinis-equi TaxID=585013 RepID=A0ABR3FU06_9AGAR
MPRQTRQRSAKASTTSPLRKRATPQAVTGTKNKAKPTSTLVSIPTYPTEVRPGLQLFVWGTNEGGFGQLGLGISGVQCVKPRRHLWAQGKMEAGGFGAKAGAGLRSVAAGGMHTLLLDEHGTVWSSGVNDDAALGRITENVRDTDEDALSCSFNPIQSLVDAGFRAVQIAAGDNIGAAVGSNGELRIWGTFRQDRGRSLFADGISHQWLPAPVLQSTRKVAGTTEKVASVACGGNHVVALTTHGYVHTWGVGDDGRLGRKFMTRHKALDRLEVEATVPQKIVLGTGVQSRKAVSVSAGQFTSFAVDDSGDVWAWGMNSRGQTGTGYISGLTDDEQCVDLPTRVVGLSSAELGNPERVVSIAGGDTHTLFLTSEGNVYVCGERSDGRLGLPDDHEVLNEDRDSRSSIWMPVLVEIPDTEADDPIVSIVAGPRYSMAITRAGVLFSWGSGPNGELGLGDGDGNSRSNVPRRVTRREGSWAVKQVSCGGQHVVGLFQRRE